MMNSCSWIVPLNQKTDFRGEIRGCELDNIWISEVGASQQRVIRSKKQIAKSTEREFKLSLQLEDTGIVNQDGRAAELHPGDFALYDSTRPYTLHFDRPFRQIVLQIPYDSLAELFLRPENITARRVSARTAVGALTSQFIQSVAGRLDILSHQERGAINQHIIELIALAMSSMSSLRELDGRSIARTAMLERIKQYIEINIRHPQLTPAQVAKHHHISERYQRMLFASTGTTLSKYILNKRLELCREALENQCIERLQHHADCLQLRFQRRRAFQPQVQGALRRFAERIPATGLSTRLHDTEAGACFKLRSAHPRFQCRMAKKMPVVPVGHHGR